MMTFSSSSEFTESFDATCQLAQAPVTFPHLMEELRGDVWKERPAGVSEARRQRLSPAGVENVRRHVAIGKCYPSTTSLTYPWPQVLNRSPIDPSVWIPGLTRTSLICFMYDGCGKSEGGEGIGERRAVWTVDSIIMVVLITHSSSDSICDCNHVFNALLQKPSPNNAVYHFSGLTKAPDGYSELSL